MKYYLCTKTLYGRYSGSLRFKAGVTYERVMTEKSISLIDEVRLRNRRKKTYISYPPSLGSLRSGFDVTLKSCNWERYFVPVIIKPLVWFRLKKIFL